MRLAGICLRDGLRCPALSLRKKIQPDVLHYILRLVAVVQHLVNPA
jgi:hypothetical protein